MINPFLYRAKDYPVRLIVDIHSYCNARCVMCPYPSYSRKQPQGQMPWSMYTHIIDEFGEIGKQYNFHPSLTYCSMAEPFLADDLAHYVDYALKKNIQVHLNTNAAAMSAQKVDELLATGFSGMIHISFHGISRNVYHRITGLDYDTVMENTRYLMENYDTERICIRGVDDDWPEGEKELWFNFWEPWGVKLEYLKPISRCGLVKRLKHIKANPNQKVRLYGCRYNHPLVEMVILFDGRAVMCCQDMAREVIWGNVAQDGILNVWNAPLRRNLVSALYSGKELNQNFLCSRCEQALTRSGMMQVLLQQGWHKIKDSIPVSSGSH